MFHLISHLSSNSMLAVRQQVLAFLGLEPTPWPIQQGDPNLLLKNGTLRSFPEPRWHGLRRRQVTSSSSTCGYLDGDPNKPRTADSGYACRVDTINALWGFCPTTIISPIDCGLAANCLDSHACNNGCGIPKNSDLTTFTCSVSGADHCSTALLQAGPDQTYSYIACAPAAKTDHLFAAATKPLASPTSSSSSIPTKQAPSNTSPSSTVTVTSSSTPLTTFKASSATTAAASKPSNSSVNNNTGAIVGGVIGGLAIIFLAGFAIFFLRLYNKRHTNKTNTEQTPMWNDGLPKIQSSVGHEPVELPGQSRLPYELPGERESVHIELDSIPRRSFHETGFS